MHSLVNLLLNIGLTEKESKAYLVSLKIGTNPASIIAKYAELNRCTTYSILESLLKKGLVFQLEKNKIRYFSAVEPRQLITLIEEKKRDLNYYQEEIDAFLPEFEALKHPHQIIPVIKTYSGKARITKLYHEVLKEPCLFIWGHPAKKQHEFFTRFAPFYLKAKKTISIISTDNRDREIYTISEIQDLQNIPPLIPIQFTGKNRVFFTVPSEGYGIEIAHNKIVEFHLNKFKSIWKKK